MDSAVERRATNGVSQQQQQQLQQPQPREFQMPLHYPRYSKSDYQTMPEWKLDCLLSQYGLPSSGSLHHKRTFAIGAFLWA